MSMGDPGSDSHPDDGDEGGEYEYEYEEVEEEIEVEEEVEEEFEEVEESEEVDDEDENGDLIEDSPDVNKIDNQNAEEELERDDNDDKKGILIKDSSGVDKIDHLNAEEEEEETEEELEEEWEEVDDEEQNGDLVKELTSVNDIEDQNGEVEAEVEVEVEVEEEVEVVEEVEDEVEDEGEEEAEEEVGAEAEEEMEEEAEKEGEVEGKEEVEEEEEEEVEEEVEDEGEEEVGAEAEEEMEEESEKEGDVEGKEEVEEEEEGEEEVEMEFEAQDVDCDDSIKELIKELTPVNQIDHQKDASQVSECHGHADDSGLSAVLQRNSVAEENTVESYAGIYGIGDFVDDRQKGDAQIYGKVIDKDFGGGTSLDDNWRNSDTNGVIGELNSGTSIIDASSKAANSDLLCENESNQTAGEEDEKQVAPRTRLRSLTPDEYSDGSKRQAVICDFFAKGWCIKGNSCTFLHVRDHAIVRQPSKGIVHVEEKKSELLDDEVSSVHNNHQSKGGETPKEKSEMHKVSLDRNECSMEIGKSFSKREIEKEDQCQYPLPVDRGSLFDGTHSSGSLKSMEVSDSKRFSSDMRNLEDATCKRGYVPDTQNSSASNTPSYKQSLPFGCSIGNTDVVSPQKMWESYKENNVSRLTSLNRSCSPFFVGESDGPSKSRFLVDSQRLAELRSRMPYNWVPSVPFRPSFVVTQRLLSTLNLYDPVRDSIDETGSDSMHGRKACKKADLVQEEGMPELDCSSSKYPESGQSSHGKYATKGTSGKDELVLDGEGMSADNTHWEDRYMSKEEKLLNTDKMSNDRGRQCEGFEYIAEAKIDKGAQRKEADANLRVDGSIFKESRVYKYFHAALVEFIKDLLRPAWHGGHLSKDAYKGIVKKVAEKVLCTLQPHQFPSTSESVEHYLALSQSKLAKLVGGYVDRHWKS